MTIASQTTAETMLGDGNNRKFPFTFRAWEGEVRVVVTDPEDRTEDVTALANIVHNSSAEGLGGIVTYPAAVEAVPVPAGYKLTVLRDMDFLQPVRLVNAARYDPVVIEQELDRLTAMIQQLREVAGRSAQFPVGSTYTPEEFLNIIYEARAQCLAAMETVSQMVEAAEVRLDDKAAQTIAALEAEVAAYLAQVQAAADGIDGKIAEALAALQTELANCLDQLNGLVARAETAANGAEDAEALAQKWAANPEDVPVTASPALFSAYHWARKAQSATGVNDASETVKGIAYAATAAEVAARVTGPSRAGAPAFVRPETLPPPPPAPEIPIATPTAPGLVPSGGTPGQIYRVTAAGAYGYVLDYGIAPYRNAFNYAKTAFAQDATGIVYQAIQASGPDNGGEQPLTNTDYWKFAWPQQYSSSEKDTGSTWIDGKKIYRKIVNCGSGPNNTTKTVSHGVSNIERVMHFYATALSGSGAGWVNVEKPPSQTVYTSSIAIAIRDTLIELATAGNFSGWTAIYVIFEYTCTNR